MSQFGRRPMMPSAPSGRPDRDRHRAYHVVDGGGDELGGLRPVDQPELALPAIVIDQWRRLVEEDVDPVGNDIRAIIAALVDLGPVAESLEQGLPVDL